MTYSSSKLKNIAATKESLAAEFKKAGLNLSDLELDRFWALHQLLEERNPTHDLTRVEGFYNLLYKHYIDGALAAEYMNPEGLTMDLGTGAGFPGLPIAIRRPGWPLLLAEPRGKRLAFMEEAVNLLGLDNVEFYPHKVGPRFDRPIDNIITRDFEPAAETVLRAAELLPKGGELYLMKGPRVDEELAEARALPQWADFELLGDKAYTLGDSGVRRRFLVLRKIASGRPVAAAREQQLKITEIASRENARYKAWLKLLDGRGIKKSGEALLGGAKIIREVISQFPEKILGLMAVRADELAALNPPAGVPLYLLRPELWPQLNVFGTPGPLMLIKADQPPAWGGELAQGLTLFLPFQDPVNLGTAIRSAAAMGAGVVLLKEAASLYHPKTVRAAGPAIFQANIQSGPPLGDLAAAQTGGLFALSPLGADIFSFEFLAALGLVAGPEGPGLDELWPVNRRLSIPMTPGVESLNAAASIAMALALWRRCKL